VPLLAAALGGILRRKGAIGEAVTLFDEILKAHKERFGPDHPLVADVLLPYANLLEATKKREMLEHAVAIYAAGQKKYGMKAPHYRDAMRQLSIACWQCKCTAHALAVAQERRQAFPDDPAWLFDTACQLARLVPVADNAGADCTCASLDTLAEAIAKGYSDTLRLQMEPLLDPVRMLPRFGELADQLPALDRDRVRIERGRLTAQDPFDRKLRQSRQRVYTVQLKAGATYRFDLISADFDPFLRVENAAGQEKAYDDDSGGDLNARLEYRPTVTEEYRIIVTSFGANEIGAFALAIQEK
jgi:hypothetical protein